MDKKTLQSKKVVLGMSGGVDSSVCLMLLKQQGFDVLGVSLKYDTWRCSNNENICCSAKSFALAKKIARAFKVEHRIVDVRELFTKQVIDYFKTELKANRTPSPCVFCNPRVKFHSLLKMADDISAEFVATGHYARVSQEMIFGKQQLVLKKGRDAQKDQSYSLSFLTQKELRRTIFPLGCLTKAEVYGLAGENTNFSSYSQIKQSQDFCFLSQKEYSKFIAEEVKPDKGPIIDDQGNIIGEHKGLTYYTLGQRKGIGLPAGPYFVTDKILPNQLIVSKLKSKAYTSQTLLRPFNLINQPDSNCLRVLVKSRSTQVLKEADLIIKENELELCLKDNDSIFTPGQIAVLYLGDICLGGGVINNV